ncbi:class I SAM-dependent methyltransferase [Desulfococcaceae bacterium HSG9]|nr:class I SAM-dependent methyltransferase [Desulfococcaceae bacterium HSG9]
MNLTSPIYWSPLLYNIALKILYRKKLEERFECVLTRIPSSTQSVLDICCGSGYIFEHYLKKKNIHYTGLDFNKKLLKRVEKIGGNTIYMKLPGKLPKADVILMMGSLYHFRGQENIIVDRMIEASREKVIILEPIKNLSSSDILGFIGKLATYIQETSYAHRFDEPKLKEIFKSGTTAIFSKAVNNKYLLIELDKL